MSKLHVSLNVTDVERSVDFYRTLCGAEPVTLNPDDATFDVADPAVIITTNQAEVAPGNALSHLGIQVASTDHVLVAKRRLQEAGLRTEDEMNAVCCYALQDKTWIEDPDGHRWEIVHVIDGDVAASRAANRGCCALSS